MRRLLRRLLAFTEELKDRRVFRVATAYLVIAWAVIEIADILTPALHLPGWVVTLVVLLALAGFPAALVLAWAFDLTPEGIRAAPPSGKEEAPASSFRQALRARWRQWTVAALAAGLLAAGGLWYFSAPRAAMTGTAASSSLSEREGARTTLAVMYFDNQTPHEKLGQVMVDMLTTNLARHAEIEVISSQRLFDMLNRIDNPSADHIGPEVATEVARRAGTEIMLMGSIAQLGTRFRIHAQLVDVQSGDILASMQERGRKVEDVFAMVDRLTEQVRAALRPDTEAQPLHIADVTTTSYEAYRRYRQGTEHLWKLELAEAADDLQAALVLDSTFAMAYHNLALAKVRTGLRIADPFADLAPARTAIDQALRYANRTTERERLLIRVRHALINRAFERASRQAAEAIRQYPNDIDVLFASSFATAFSEGAPQKRIPILERILEIDPRYAPAHNHLAYVHTYTGNFEQAISHVRRYLALYPEVLNAHDSAWEIYMKAGRFEEAYETAVAALQKHPGAWASAHYWAGWASLLQDKQAKAHDHFQRLVDAEPSLQARLQKGHAHVYAGRYAEALRLYQEAFERTPRDEAAWRRWGYVGQLRRMQGKPAAARDAFAKMAAASEAVFESSFNPGRVYAAFLSGLTWAEAGNAAETQQALAGLRRMIREQQQLDALHQDYVHLLQAALRIQQGRGAEALAALEQVTGVTEIISPYYSKLLPAAYAAQGATERAIASHQRFAGDVARTDRHGQGHSVAFFYNRSLLDYRLGRLYEKQGQPETAAAHYRTAIQRWAGAEPDLPALQKARQRLARLEDQLEEAALETAGNAYPQTETGEVSLRWSAPGEQLTK